MVKAPTTNKHGHTSRTCARCYQRVVHSKFTKDETICDDCIDIKPRNEQTKKKTRRKYSYEKEIFNDWMGGNSVYL